MDVDLKQVAREVRKSILTQVFTAKSGHLGGSLSATEILTYLYFKEMHVDPTKPNCPCRDRFVLSKGHVTPAWLLPQGRAQDVPRAQLAPPGSP